MSQQNCPNYLFRYPVIPNFVPGAMPMTHGNQIPPTTMDTPEASFGSPQGGFEAGPGAPIQQDVNYTQGYLRTQIGKKMRVEFLIGTNMLTDRQGTLLEVGISYIILRLAESDDILLCDIYSIKFVTIFQ